MTALFAANYISNASRTNAQVKQALEDLRSFVAEQPGGGLEQALTIATGSVTPASGAARALIVDTEAAAASDDLANIIQTNAPEGSLMLLRNANSARTVVVKHNAGGAGQITLQGSADRSLVDAKTYLILMRVGTDWVEIGFLPLSGGGLSGLLTLNGGGNITPAATPAINAIGYLGAPTDIVNAAYTFVMGDAGKAKLHDEATARTWTIPANASVAFPIGTVIIIDNTGNAGAAGTITLAITTDTLRRGDGTAGTGSRTIAASRVAAIRKMKATEWVITGSFT
jgi:hypothetical protein